MIDLYTWATPNGRKVSILLEELALDYKVHAVNIGAGEQKTPEFLKISPNGKIPAIVEQETRLALFESGAIMLYLAEKHGRFIPSDPLQKARVVEWLMWQMGGLGPMAGQGHHYLHFNPGNSKYAEERLLTEITRLYRVLNERLEGRDYICDEYSIADMACWPWVSRYAWHKISLGDFPNVKAWYLRLAARDAVQKGYDVPKKVGKIPLD